MVRPAEALRGLVISPNRVAFRLSYFVIPQGGICWGLSCPSARTNILLWPVQLSKFLASVGMASGEDGSNDKPWGLLCGAQKGDFLDLLIKMPFRRRVLCAKGPCDPFGKARSDSGAMKRGSDVFLSTNVVDDDVRSFEPKIAPQDDKFA